VKFLVDNQLPETLAKYLCTKGHDAQHVLRFARVMRKEFAKMVLAELKKGG